MNDAVIGKEVDGYHVESVLGRGGMGVVYKAEDVALSRPVALKRINPAQAHREQFLRRFRSEAKALARINSPFITSIYALRDTDIGLLIVMEYVDGGTLKDKIQEGPMPPGRVLPVVQQILQAFRDAHGAGVIHRDIKPQNIMMTRDGAVKITDFGIAKLRRKDSGETVTQGGQGGTLKYMSPEQIEQIDEVDNRSDLYALGMTMYEMLAGRLPFDELDTDFDIMRKVVEGTVPEPEEFVPNLPKELAEVIHKATATNPGNRFASAEEMLETLDRVAEKLEGTDPQPMWDLEGDDTHTSASSGPASDDTAAAGDTATDDTATDDTGTESGTILDDSLLDEIGGSGESDSASAKERDQKRSSQPAASRQSGSSSRLSVPAGSASPTNDPASEANSSGISLGAVAGIVVAVLVAAAGAYFALTPSGGPTITLSTSPAGAAVKINGDSVGTTPLSNHSLDPGTHIVEIRKAGYTGVDTSLALGTGQALVISGLQLRARPVQFQVTSEPTGADVMVGASRIGTTPILDAEVSAGRADVRVEKEGYAALDTTLQFAPGSRMVLSGIRLEEDASAERQPTATGGRSDLAESTSSESPTPQPSTSRSGATASLTVETDGNVRVEAGGTVQQGSGTLTVPVGTQTIRCTHPDYGAIETTRTVSQNDTDPVSCVFQQVVNVTTQGVWGNVWVNGENTEESTPHVLTLPPGRHNVEVRFQRDNNVNVRGGIFRRTDPSGDEDPIEARFSGPTYTIDVEPGFKTYKQVLVFRTDS